MPTIRNDEVEAEARALLREQIDRSPWFREGPDRRGAPEADQPRGRRLVAPQGRGGSAAAG